MGGNSSYSEDWGGVPEVKRTHDETGYCVERHKVLVAKGNPKQKKNILNSNSENATYIIAKRGKDGTIMAESINVYKGHELCYEINLVFDSKGNIVPFNGGKGSHAHHWYKNSSDGNLKRQRHDKGNSFPIDSSYNSLIADIVRFNKKHNK